jgi:PAS domain S-box-containing protein
MALAGAFAAASAMARGSMAPALGAALLLLSAGTWLVGIPAWCHRLIGAMGCALAAPGAGLAIVEYLAAMGGPVATRCASALGTWPGAMPPAVALGATLLGLMLATSAPLPRAPQPWAAGLATAALALAAADLSHVAAGRASWFADYTFAVAPWLASACLLSLAAAALWDRRLVVAARSPVFSLGAALVGALVLGGYLLFFALANDSNAQLRRQTEEARNQIEGIVVRGVGENLREVGTAVEVLGRLHPARYGPGWELVARLSLGIVPSLSALWLVDGDQRLLREFVPPESVPLPLGFDFGEDPALAEAFTRSEGSGIPVLSELTLLPSGREGIAAVRRFLEISGEPTGGAARYVMGVVSAEDVLARYLPALAPGFAVAVQVDDQELFRRPVGEPDPPEAVPRVVLSPNLPGGSWMLRIWSTRSQRALSHGWEPLFVLLLLPASAVGVSLTLATWQVADRRAAELATSERRLASSNAIGRLGSWRVQVASGDAEWSTQVYDLIGVDPDAQVASRKAFEHFVHPEDRIALRSAFERAASGDLMDIVHRIVRPDGEVRWAHHRGQRVPGTPDDAPVVEGIVQDVTELWSARREQHASEERLRAVAEALRFLAYEENPETGRRSWVGAAAEVTGKALESLPTETAAWLAMIHEEDRDRIARERTALGDASSPYETEYRLPDGAGQVRWCRERVVERAEPGGRVVRLGVVEHITSARAAELERREYARQLAKVAALTRDLVGEPDRQRLLQLIVDGAREITGARQAVISYTSEDGHSQTIQARSLASELASWRDRPLGTVETCGLYAVVCETNAPLRLTSEQLERESRWRDAAEGRDHNPPLRGFLAAPLRTREGRNLGLLQVSDRGEGEFTAAHELLLVHLSELGGASLGRLDLLAALETMNQELESRVERRTEALATANRELERFSYSVSHDLRAPLRAISGFSRILLEDYAPALDERGLHYLERVNAGADRLGRLIDDLLELARVGRTHIAVEPLDLSALAREVVAQLRAAEPDRTVRVEMHELPGARGDRRLASLLLQNLIGNAWKYTSKRDAARIEIGAEHAPSGDGDPVYYVRDNGVGFDMQYADKLFGVFQRLHRDEEFPGTGVGLATARRIVEMHNGSISGEGRPDGGAVFRFTLRGTG